MQKILVRNFCTLRNFRRVRNCLLCAAVHPSFDILTFFFHFLFVSPICLHCNSACFYLLVILYWVLSIKDPRRDTIKNLFLIINKKKFGSQPFASSCFFSFSITFSPFLTSQTSFEDDNSEDEWLETLSL